NSKKKKTDLVNSKVCAKCKKEKHSSKFNRNCYTKDGLSSYCKTCSKAKRSNWKENNPEKYKKQKKRDRVTNKDYYTEYLTLYKKERRQNDENFRLRESLSQKTRYFLIGRLSENKGKKLLGCTLDKFKKHLQSQFKDGMTWDNYGNGGWEIDHVIPTSVFDPTCPYQHSVCWHYTNTQPLWGDENSLKNNNIPDLGIEIDQEWLEERGIR
ncbi:MAG TPA: hypothetical protein VLA13_00350, partial [Massilibacterium sp.]|nr:hypothetical protein [Massilibacterium sp.]